MPALTTRDYRRVLELVRAIVDGMAAGPAAALIAQQLNDAFRGSTTVYHGGFDVRRGTMRSVVWVPAAADEFPWEVHLRECGITYPLAPVCAAQVDLMPLTISDVIDDLAWRRTACYSAIRHNTDGSSRHLAIPLPAPAGIARAFIVRRPGRDYTLQEREFARVVQPLLCSLDRHLSEVERLRAKTREQGTGLERGAQEAGLTPRELAVLNVVAEGLTADAAGRRLGISHHTVNKHLENLYRKLGARDRLTAVLTARDLRLLPAPQSDELHRARNLP